MATYREIHGKAVKSLSTDPSAETDAGQIWYNTASDTFKSIVNSQAWASAAPTINLTNAGAGAGTTTAGLTFGGRNPPGPAFVATTEEYNGDGWAAGGALNTARSYLAGFGTQTAAVAAGGRIDAPGTSTNATEEYNGSAWTTVNTMGTARRVGGSAGLVQTAGLAIGGGPPGVATTEEYDGTNWTSGGGLNTARFYLAGFGTLTSAVAAGGNGGESAVEEYNGSSWTTVTSLGSGRTQLGSSGSSETAGLVFGGEAPGPAVKALTESYDGTSWTESADLATARRGLSGSTGHSGTKGIAVAGFPTYNLTEEFNSSATAITVAAWSSAPSLNTSRAAVGRSGIAPTQNAALCVSGYPGPPSTIDVKNVEEFDGSSWTEVGDVNSQRYNGMCAGTTTAGLFFGGNSDVTPGTKPLPLSEEWDGSSWTAGNTMQNGNEAAGGFGTQTAAVQAGGSLNPYPNYTNTTEEYNGTSWSDVPATIFASVAGVTGVGTETAGLIFCGTQAPPPGTNYSTAQTYNGTAFTTVNACVETGNKLVGGGTQTAAFGAGGGPGNKSRVQHYDGTTWSTAAALGTGRGNSSGGAPQAAGIYYAGNPGSGSTGATEQFTGETTAVNVKTLTQS